MLAEVEKLDIYVHFYTSASAPRTRLAGLLDGAETQGAGLSCSTRLPANPETVEGAQPISKEPPVILANHWLKYLTTLS